MIGKLTGRLSGTSVIGEVLIEVGGVGYCVRTPLLALTSLSSPPVGGTGPNGAPFGGSEVSLFIYTRVAEDALDLYGFPTEEELAFFKQLMSVSGIGPKTALGILNVADVTSLKRAIAAGDAATLTKVFGIGKKSSERLVVELRDKVSLSSGTAGSFAAGDGNDAEVVEALMALGYRADEARTVLKEISGDSVNERLASALKYLGTAKRA
jgi:Holliday junction DNA helicase RuvA